MTQHIFGCFVIARKELDFEIKNKTFTLKSLKTIPRKTENPFVIICDIVRQHLKDMQTHWRRIRKHTDLPDIRIHDLRHTFTSKSVALGKPL